MKIEFDPFAVLATLCVVGFVIGGFIGPVSYWWTLVHYWQQILMLLGVWLLAVAALLKVIDWGTN